MKRSPLKRKTPLRAKSLTNKPKKRKTDSVSALKKKADAAFSIYIRMRDSDRNGIATCITCNTKKPWKEMQNGHFIKRSVSLLRFDEENCNAQCPACNVWKYGELYQYGKALDLKYGDGTAERLHAQRHTTHKFKAQELIDIIEECKENIKAYA